MNCNSGLSIHIHTSETHIVILNDYHFKTKSFKRYTMVNISEKLNQKKKNSLTITA